MDFGDDDSRIGFASERRVLSDILDDYPMPKDDGVSAPKLIADMAEKYSKAADFSDAKAKYLDDTAQECAKRAKAYRERAVRFREIAEELRSVSKAEVSDAFQDSEAGTDDGGGGSRSRVRQEGRDSTIGGPGLQ
jgi:hypothetical protein